MRSSTCLGAFLAGRHSPSAWLMRVLGGVDRYVRVVVPRGGTDEPPDLAAHRQPGVVVDYVVDAGPAPRGGRLPGAIGHLVRNLREVVADHGRSGTHEARVARRVGRVGRGREEHVQGRVLGDRTGGPPG